MHTYTRRISLAVESIVSTAVYKAFGAFVCWFYHAWPAAQVKKHQQRNVECWRPFERKTSVAPSSVDRRRIVFR